MGAACEKQNKPTPLHYRRFHRHYLEQYPPAKFIGNASSVQHEEGGHWFGIQFEIDEHLGGFAGVPNTRDLMFDRSLGRIKVQLRTPINTEQADAALVLIRAAIAMTPVGASQELDDARRIWAAASEKLQAYCNGDHMYFFCFTDYEDFAARLRSFAGYEKYPVLPEQVNVNFVEPFSEYLEDFNGREFRMMPFPPIFPKFAKCYDHKMPYSWIVDNTNDQVCIDDKDNTLKIRLRCGGDQDGFQPDDIVAFAIRMIDNNKPGAMAICMHLYAGLLRADQHTCKV